MYFTMNVKKMTNTETENDIQLKCKSKILNSRKKKLTNRMSRFFDMKFPFNIAIIEINIPYSASMTKNVVIDSTEI